MFTLQFYHYYTVCVFDLLFIGTQKYPKCRNHIIILSLFHWIFATRESNQGLLNCRWILYQLSSQGSPGKVRVCCIHVK